MARSIIAQPYTQLKLQRLPVPPGPGQPRRQPPTGPGRRAQPEASGPGQLLPLRLAPARASGGVARAVKVARNRATRESLTVPT